jgi:hypothetical protein
MPTERQYREILISAFEHLERQNSALHDLMTEIASIRDALIEIGPKYADVLERHRSRRMRETKSIAASDSAKFAAIVEILRTMN